MAMKNVLIACVAFVMLCVCVCAITTSKESIVINEVELNPYGNDLHSDVYEWVELYNPTDDDIDLSGWTLSTTHGKTVTVYLSGVIKSHGYYVYRRGKQWLDNEDESVVLKGPYGFEIDRTPKLSDDDNDAYTWQRCDDSWIFAYETEGKANNCPTPSPTPSPTPTPTPTPTLTPTPTPTTIYVPDDYEKIQWAVDNASAGDAIIVRDGTYYESITVSKQLTIKSENSPEKCIVNGTGSNVFTLLADGIRIEGFTITGGRYGIFLWMSDNNNISNNIISSNNFDGIFLLFSEENNISNNIISSNNNGIFLNYSWNNNIISKNNISSNNYGIFLWIANENIIYLNNFINNTYNAISYGSNIWNSTEPITYTYRGSKFINYLGNYWDDYNGSDENGDGIGDIPYSINADEDKYPLIERFENYFVPTPTPTPTPSPTPTPTPTPTCYPPPSPNPYIWKEHLNTTKFGESGIVSAVIDGDTIDISGVGRVRLADINTPEKWEEGYEEAKEFVENMTLGKKVYLDIDDFCITGKYGRIIAVVYAPYGNECFVNLNQMLLKEGYAEISDYYNEFSPYDWYEPLDVLCQFDCEPPEKPYPSIAGTFIGEITPNKTIIATKLYTYPCEGTGGHTEHAFIWNETWCAYAEWDGYIGDWKNISFNRTVILMPNETYNLKIVTGSYPQIHHTKSIKTENGLIKCKAFKDVNGRKHEWIPAIKFTL